METRTEIPREAANIFDYLSLEEPRRDRRQSKNIIIESHQTTSQTYSYIKARLRLGMSL